MPPTLITAGLDRLIKKAGSLSAIDFDPLMNEWQLVIDHGNELGVLAGTDGRGRPMTPVVYRPAKPGKTRTVGPFTILNRPNDNPTTAWYRTMDGPPLAPRRLESRSIKNFVTRRRRISDREWEASGAWINVLSPAAVPFLPFHFRGEGRLPVRDLAGVRPDDRREARRLLRDFVKRKLAEP